ncbi:ATP-binding protein [Jannaschia sp. S6380]|uniref:sensor histidine kinase n=1 Tax=Jannaschia sp. S6380 TaxID=2926408 RepID=UPI001FF36E61|nr:ATP-binding protein [Jannaschia sp. S6380]MCK0166224.1 ATP-binding protein [Jannaschia sp. S6380]
MLGDELIGTPRLAVFELVKNAYDADASSVSVSMRLDASPARITIQDDGTGMTLETIRDIWLVPGNGHRGEQRRNLHRSERYNRLPLGEKGIGRFAAHKLGERIELVTRAKDALECRVVIDWTRLIRKKYLEDASVKIAEREPKVFTENETGTRIRITGLRTTWQRGEIRRLYNQMLSMTSPFEGAGEFQAELEVPGYENWIEDLYGPDDVIDVAPWKFMFDVDQLGRVIWSYSFRGIPGIKVSPRWTRSRKRMPIPLRGGNEKSRKTANADFMKGIGPVHGVIYAYDRDAKIISQMSNAKSFTDYLDDNGGVRVYRDGVRVYNYGEAGDDWLGLDLRRVNAPQRKLSRNILIGSVSLDLQHSGGLIEKTNREGFVENDRTERLREVALGAIQILEIERFKDKELLRERTSAKPVQGRPGVVGTIEALRDRLRDGGVLKTYGPYVDSIEHEYETMQEALLQAGMAGVNLALIFHEVERGVRSLEAQLGGADSSGPFGGQVQELVHLLQGFSALLRQDKRVKHAAKDLIDNARLRNASRFHAHGIQLECPSMNFTDPGFHATFQFGLVMGALNNLIDNAIYWLDLKAETEGADFVSRLYIDFTYDLPQGPAIVVADNGPGFGADTPQDVVRPFFSRRPDGIGLGLYFSRMAMESMNGELVFPDPGQVDLPPGYDGAVVAIVFRKAS